MSNRQQGGNLIKDLSIIIPHYNIPNLLKRTIDSIPALDNIQVIVVDDNSTIRVDEYESLKNSFPYVTFLNNDTEQNSAGICRNIGMRHAEGKWLLFADADDFFVDGFYKIIEKYFSTDYDIVYFSPTSLESSTNTESIRHLRYEKLVRNYINDSSKMNMLKLLFDYFVTWSKLLRNDFVQKHLITFDDTLVANDVMFSTKTGFHANNIFATNEIIYCVTQKKGSLTTRITREYLFIRLEIFIKRYNYLKAHLSERDFTILNITGLDFIVETLLQKQSIKTILYVLQTLKKNNIKMVDKRLFNISLVLYEIKKYRIRKRSYVK